MIKSLKLLNFRRVVEDTMTFTPGLNVLRGANESSKTTRLEAILYAWFGTTALRESLADTVTWGQPEGALKVTLDFSFDGKDYTITRAKSGATLQGPDVTVTGQKEVRLYVERLLGVTADMAASLLFADQNSVRGVLNQGATAAGGLVEKLADLSVIEQLVDKIEAQLPSGNTKALQLTLDAQKTALAGELIAPDATEMLAAKAEAEGAAASCRAAALAISVAEPGVKEAEEVVKLAQAMKDHNARESARKKVLEAKLNIKVEEPAVGAAQIEQYEKDAAGVNEAAERYAAYQTKFPKADFEWEGTVAGFHEALVKAEANLATVTADVQALKVRKVQVEAKAIKDNTCAFCLKDLTDVPEVVKLNASVAEELAGIVEQTKIAQTLQQELTEEIAALKSLNAVASKIEKLANTKYWKLSDTMPPVPAWIGEAPSVPGEVVDTKPLRKAWTDYNLAIEMQKQAQAELDTLEFKAEINTDAAQGTIQAMHELQQGLKAADQLYTELSNKFTEIGFEHVRLEAAYNTAVAAKAAAQQAVTDLESTLEKTASNNALIKKLRSAREPIATKLWATTLHAVSHYFSEIRGEASTITRDAAGFKCNGKAIEGLSGSTLDSLGLAIRLALSKIFLPNVPFLFLDEAAAGCDDAREIAMLGVVAASGFQQVLLVTHSDLGDSLATNLINV